MKSFKGMWCCAHMQEYEFGFIGQWSIFVRHHLALGCEFGASDHIALNGRSTLRRLNTCDSHFAFVEMVRAVTAALIRHPSSMQQLPPQPPFFPVFRPQIVAKVCWADIVCSLERAKCLVYHVQCPVPRQLIPILSPILGLVAHTQEKTHILYHPINM